MGWERWVCLTAYVHNYIACMHVVCGWYSCWKCKIGESSCICGVQDQLTLWRGSNEHDKLFGDRERNRGRCRELHVLCGDFNVVPEREGISKPVSRRPIEETPYLIQYLFLFYMYIRVWEWTKHLVSCFVIVVTPIISPSWSRALSHIMRSIRVSMVSFQELLHVSAPTCMFSIHPCTCTCPFQ